MKKTLKIFFIFFTLIVVFAFGFILTLHLFEFRPEQVTNLEVQAADQATNTISKNTSITVLTFNTGYASLSETEDFVMDGGKKAKMDSLAEVENNINGIKNILSRENTDIYLLQEVDTNSKRSYETNQYQTYQDLLGIPNAFAYNYRSIFVPFPLNPSQMMGKVNSGIATFSKFEITSATRIQLPGEFPWPIRLANLKRALLITRHPIEGSEQELVVINVHLSAYDDGSMRKEEMVALQNIMLEEYEKGNYVLVGGDFNQSFPDALLNYNDQEDYEYKDPYQLKEDNYWEAFPLDPLWFSQNNFNLAVDANHPTCRLLHQAYDTSNIDNNQYYLIDGFIVSNNIDIEYVETIQEDFKYSDHNPVKISIILK